MASGAEEPPEPAASGPDETPGESRAEAAAPEAYGPLLVERHRKDDGRALILYRRRRER